jgi:four helix bundle protein
MGRNFKTLKAWELADNLAVELYRVTQAFPKEEQYGLTSQVRRAAVSVAANIAEGSSRRTKKDLMHFLVIARASLAEVE